ncbi:amino acid adenylation domain-containing protein [Nocardia sp. NBC_01503]|uniref:amino acid adenylation domain-containing protein n=1 Tax=Nocardia sp. NBC_01503 TaxID=2975997 RepID=UPI002E7C02F1|nr:amino acid adenylation domain-containing protein [Nocardia sp. NBC_01503]WTL30831.1 amino acid adenylation domain-containing protein [Nocardia sp. NBC_01503]
MRTVIADAAPAAGLPLSAAQLRWWVAQQLYPEVPNTVAMYLTLRGPLRVDLLGECAALAAAEVQSPLLRFRIDSGYPTQFLDRDAFGPLRFEDFSALSEADAVAVAVLRMERDHGSPLDLIADPPTVATVFRVAREHHLLYLRSHHIVLDGIGAAVMLRRTVELYAAATGLVDSGEPGRTLSGCPLTIAELLQDERAYADSARARADGEYWREQLAGMPDPVRLAGRSAVRPRTPHRVTALVPPHTAQSVAAWRQRGYTLPELTIAAFACYLAALTGAEDIVLSLPVAARPTAALRRSAGSVSNVVPLWLREFRDGTAAGVVDQVRARVVGALRHQRYRYEDIQRDRGESHTVRGGFGPVVNMLGAVAPLNMGPLTAQVQLLALGPVEDLLVNGYQLGPDDNAITIGMQANSELYSADSLRALHQRFLAYFDGFLADPDRPVRSLEPGGVRATPAAAGADRLLPDLLRGRLSGSGSEVKPCAEDSALQDGSLSWSYRELDEMSSRWARELIETGAGPGTAVLVAVPRSAESVLAVWAVAKTGAAFVPVDPADPAHRLGIVAADSGARHGMTVTSARDALPVGPEWLVLDDPETRARVRRRAGAPIRDPERIRPLRPDHSAYLIYTSGTTGTPKGVAVTHRGLGPLTDHIVEHYGVDRDSRVLHAHAPSFDAHLLELLAAFAAGATLIVEPPSVVAGAALAELLNEAAITHFLTTPAVLATLTPEQVPTLRVAVVGGESCPADLVRRWGPALRLFNGYGPTETTVMATQSAALMPTGPVSIGPALPGVRALILDHRLHPVPACCAGELYLGGPGVARGYLGRAGATAERFVADPSGSGERVYRTGDLVHSALDGTLEFRGRADDQLSVRGRRAEPAEVEAALTTLPEVAHAVVTVQEGPGGIRLIGYIVAAQSNQLDHADLIARLRELLPAALVPAQLVEMDRLPVTAHGKIDRSALPVPPVVRQPYRAPESELQRLVADHFAKITETERVGLDDDFFEVGGNSLTGVALSAELAAATGLPMTVRWLYTAPTVRELAARLAEHAGGSATDDALGVVLTLRRNGSRPPLFCVHSAVPLAWCYGALAQQLDDRPVYGLQALTLEGEPRAGATIDDLADGYVQEILRVRPEGPYHLLGWSLGGQIAHAIAIRLAERGAEVATLAMLDSIVFPDDMPQPPLPRMRDLLTHLLGDEPEDGDELADLTAEQAAAELAAAPASFGTGLTAEQLTRLHRGYADGVRLSHDCRPGVFDGDLLYFLATRGVTESLGADMWKPHVEGALIEHPVATTHAQFCNADVVPIIGPLLAAHLEAGDGR